MRKKVVSLMLGLSVVLSAECPLSVKKKFVSVVSIVPFNLTKLEKLHNKCENNKEINMIFWLAQADASEKREETEEAYALYLKSLNVMGTLSNDVRDSITNLSAIENYLNKQMERYQPVTSEEITTRTYRGTRGADMSVEYRVENLPINFRTGISKIEAKVNLKQAQYIAEALSIEKYKSKVIYITGYTDTRGKIEKNRKLGQSRATSLKKYLKSVAKLKNEIVSDTKGEAFPIYNKVTGKEDFYKSRRVTITIGDD